MTSTTFSDGTHSLATDASAVTAVATSCAVGTTCANASDGVALPVAVPAATTAPAAVQMLDAATDTGMGDLDATATVQVSIPAGSFAGTYTSTVSLAVASGP